MSDHTMNRGRSSHQVRGKKSKGKNNWLSTGVYVQSISNLATPRTRPVQPSPMGDIGTFAAIHGQFSRNALTKKRTGAEWAGRRRPDAIRDRFNRAGRHAQPRGGRSRCRAHGRGEGGSLQILSDIEPGSAWLEHSWGCVLLTVPPEVAEGGTEAWCKRTLISIC